MILLCIYTREYVINELNHEDSRCSTAARPWMIDVDVRL